MKTSSLMKMRHVFTFWAAVAWAPGVSSDVALTGPFTPTTGTAEAAFMTANAPAILHLSAEARTGTTDDRLAALETLSNSYSNASLNLATELVEDLDTGVAAESARLLADTLAMVGSAAMGAQMYAPGTSARRQYDAAVGSLRGAVCGARIEIRDVASGTLAGLGDGTALDQIDRCVEQGVMSGAEAIGYFALAPIELGARYIERYLDTGAVEAKVAAVGYLGTVVAYQHRVRDLILGTEQVDETVVAKAAGVLSRHDRDFPVYALEVIRREGVPEPVSDAVVEAYVSGALRIKAVDRSDWTYRVRAVDNALGQHPGDHRLNMIKAGLQNRELLMSQ